MINTSRKKLNTDDDYPPVAELVSDGWESGAKPYLRGDNYNSK